MALWEPGFIEGAEGEHGAPVRRAATTEAAEMMASFIAEGARTGLANVVTGLLFLAAMFITPLVEVVPFEAVAPAMVVVGFLMAKNVVRIDWDDWGIAVPSFLTFVLMPFTYSIADGIGAGFISYVFIRVVQGRIREIHPLMWVVAAAFVAYFGIGVIEGWIL